MELIILGSGTGVPSSRRGSPGILLRVEGKDILLEIGSGILGRLPSAGTSYEGIDAILLSHLHPDHVCDLVPFLFACRYELAPRRKDLLIMGGKGLKAHYEGLRRVYGRWVQPQGFQLHLQEMNYGEREIGGVRVKVMPMLHTEGSVGYRIEGEGRVLAYSGDTDYCPEVVELAQGADLLILECSFPEGMKVQGHLIPSVAGRIAQEAGVRRLLLTHFYPPCDEADVLTQCKASFEGEVMKAEDMMRVEIEKRSPA